MLIQNLIGKGGRIRTIKIPQWAESALRDWISILPNDGLLLRSVSRYGAINGSLSVTAIRNIVSHYSEVAGVHCSPHDLRRTFAQLSRKGGAPLEAIQHSLGHASIRTTEVYLKTGEESNAGDFILL